VGSVASPFFFLVFLGMGFGTAAAVSGIPQGENYVSFLTPGIIGMTLLFSSTFAGLSVLWDREFGFLKEIMVAPVSRIAIVLGRTAGGVTTAIIQAMIILLSGILLGMKAPDLLGLLLSLVFMVLIASTFIGLGLAFASKMEDMSGFSLIMNFLIFPLFFLSGALFPLDRFPPAIRFLSYLNPLTYGVDGLRYCLIGVSELPPALDFVVLAVSCVAILGLGAYLFETSEVK
ncbi:MAG: ABC transporter permease, partial [Methanotrichaceae archaeon]|nr:ABC transporter permease [Methanotrichaceae archaeon]